MTSFLPSGYESLIAGNSYWKTKEMREGDNRLRIMLPPIGGWLDWNDKKPVRYRPENRPVKSYDPENPYKAFWAMYVWDYAREGLYILEIQQVTLINALVKLGKDPDWGDFTKYDIKITKTGSSMQTRYAVTAVPHSSLSRKQQEALESSPVRLEALYDGGDPWSDLLDPEPSMRVFEAPASKGSIGTPLETLREYLEVDGIDASELDNYLTHLSAVKNQPIEVCIESALLSQYLPKFKAAYTKHCGISHPIESVA